MESKIICIPHHKALYPNFAPNFLEKYFYAILDTNYFDTYIVDYSKNTPVSYYADIIDIKIKFFMKFFQEPLELE